MPESCEPAGTAVLVVDGKDAGPVHLSVLASAADLGARLGCRTVVELGRPPARFDGERLRRLRRELNEVMAFADAARRTGWTLGRLAAAPCDRPVVVLDVPQGRVWAHPERGFELHDADGAHPITELAGLPGTARRTALSRLLLPLAEAAGRAERLEVRRPDG